MPAPAKYSRSLRAHASQPQPFAAHGYPQGVARFRVKGLEIAAALDACAPLNTDPTGARPAKDGEDRED